MIQFLNEYSCKVHNHSPIWCRGNHFFPNTSSGILFYSHFLVRQYVLCTQSFSLPSVYNRSNPNLSSTILYIANLVYQIDSLIWLIYHCKQFKDYTKRKISNEKYNNLPVFSLITFRLVAASLTSKPIWIISALTTKMQLS